LPGKLIAAITHTVAEDTISLQIAKYRASLAFKMNGTASLISLPEAFQLVCLSFCVLNIPAVSASKSSQEVSALRITLFQS